MASLNAEKHLMGDAADDCLSVKRMRVSVEQDLDIKNYTPGAEQLTEETGEKETDATFVQEKDVGITEYISEFPGFYGVLKGRYSDFLVNEIDMDGNVVRLTDLKEPAQESVLEDARDLLGEVDVQLLEDLSRKTKEPGSVTIDVTDKDKEMRRKIHQVIRKCFKGLHSTTESADDNRSIVVKNGQSKRGNYNPPKSGNYAHFVLYKENKDTMDAVSTVSSIISLPGKNISYAGTKDKRGKTVQRMSAYRADVRKLLSINNRHKFIRIGNVVHKNAEIKLGDLSGNNFVVVLRMVEGEPSLIDKAVLSLSSKGFINYYGMQRFGTTSVATHRIGRSLLLRNWKNAIDLILHPRTGAYNEELNGALKVWSETRDASSALEKLQRRSTLKGIEGRLLSGLAKHNEKDFVNALNSIPRNTRLIYIHSYQSYIWNKVVSRRVQKYGLRILPGDLIMEEVDEIVEIDDKIPSPPKRTPRYVTDEDLQNADLIYSVVVPLPGHSMMYPNNETKSWYEEFLAEDGMNMGSFQSNVKCYSLSGSYRKMVVKPTGVKYELIPYDDHTVPLVLSDWDVLQGQQLLPTVTEGKFLALKLEFGLPSSSYATMAVREVLKIDTCRCVQKALPVQ